MEIIINIIPSDYKGDPKKALGYCWQNYSEKVEGFDIIVDDDSDKSKEGLNKVIQAKIIENGADSAYVNKMWCGGDSYKVKIEDDTCKDDTCKDDTIEETAPLTIEKEIEKISDAEETHGIGWCNKCHSYCFGDCEAN